LARDDVQIAVAVEVAERRSRQRHPTLAVEWIGGSGARREEVAVVREQVEDTVELAHDELGDAVAVEISECRQRGCADILTVQRIGRTGSRGKAHVRRGPRILENEQGSREVARHEVEIAVVVGIA
jgi:hypothetical protein